ncbi:D-3-phosphoglycerate dehydrogenase [Artemisia annua]|uniref:D-3-phosphoglycerate dehydrogenase n=1 Tax=Artemisia annua TaxID=35608 RepID=A0A2U1LU14_ARTAN|nr:D-3-phosphoglycerate dehydrogenase [Artemisia annua]
MDAPFGVLSPLRFCNRYPLNWTVLAGGLDVYTVEPPPKDNILVNHEKVTVTLHLGAITTEAQEGVAIEINEAAVGALKDEGM